MKNSVQSNIRSGLLAAAITGSLVLSAASAFAADVILSGSVGAITTITTGGDTSLGSTLGTAGLSDFTVATATEKNNVTAGYVVTLHSASAAAASSGSRNVSKLQLDGTGTATKKTIIYTMKYGGTSVSLGASTGEAAFDRDAVVNTPSGDDKALQVTTSAATSNEAGTYTDTVTLTIAAK